MALFLRQEGGALLPRVYADDESAALDLLCTEREAAVFDATRLRNQIHALLMQIDPEYRDRLPRLTSRAGVQAVVDYVSADAAGLQQLRVAVVRRLAARLTLTLAQAGDLAQQIERLAAARCSPLTRLCGVNLLTAGQAGDSAPTRS